MDTTQISEVASQMGRNQAGNEIKWCLPSMMPVLPPGDTVY